MLENAQQKSETTITENMINKLSNEIEDRKNYFETVHLNVPEYSDSKDEHIDSLFGDKDFNQISHIIYEKDLISSSKISKLTQVLSRINTRKIKLATTLTLLISAASFAGFSFLSLEDNNFVADASPLSKIESQNTISKESDIKIQIASGDLYNDNYTFRYKLKEGDTLEKVSEKSGISQEAIKAMNNIESDTNIQTKISLLIPTTQNIIHKVVNGDTLEGVAKKYNVSIRSITELNKNNLRNPNYLTLDQILFIPFADSNKSQNKEKVSLLKNETKLKLVKANNSRESNSVHKIVSGDTLSSIAKKYKVSLTKITEANTNLNLSKLKINQPLIIPTNQIDRNGSRSRNVRLASRSLSAGTNQKGTYSGRFFWPASGEFSSGFGQRGSRPHRGIDIAAAVGTPIMSVMDGTVIYTGWESGYGMSVEIKHPNGLVTRYAHCSQIFVSKGQKVEGGQKIAAMGTTGHVTGPHLHFEVLVNGVQVNPRNYF